MNTTTPKIAPCDRRPKYSATMGEITEYFGLRSHGAIFGVVVFFGTIGGALGLIMAGSVFDIWSSYGPAFGGLAALAAIGLVLAFRLPAPDRQRFDGPGPVEG